MGRLPRDKERINCITEALKVNGLDAFVCTLASNVLMLSGYWPVVGTSIAIATREGKIAVVAPADEEEFASESWADVVRTFKGGSLDDLRSITEAARRPLVDLKNVLAFGAGTKIGLDGGPCFDPSGYAATFSYGAGFRELLTSVFPSIEAVEATECLEQLRSKLTSRELDVLRRACEIARKAFAVTARAIAPGKPEFEIAALLRSKLAADAGGQRCDGFAYCMSGPNSARAYSAFQQSGPREIAAGDFVLLHCNSYCGGFWTDITRTYCIGQPPPEKAAIMNAVLDACGQAIGIVRPGVKTSAVDNAAREVLDRRGFGSAFKHPTGHGVGFAAINHNARPRIHPLSDEVLETGMVFNIEPGVYIPEIGGMRHCDMVAVTENGVELLTPFQRDIRELIL